MCEMRTPLPTKSSFTFLVKDIFIFNKPQTIQYLLPIIYISPLSVCKINIDSDGRLAMTALIRKTFAENPGEFDPRKYLGPARDALKVLYKHKVTDVLGSAGKA